MSPICLEKFPPFFVVPNNGVYVEYILPLVSSGLLAGSRSQFSGLKVLSLEDFPTAPVAQLHQLSGQLFILEEEEEEEEEEGRGRETDTTGTHQDIGILQMKYRRYR